MRFRKLGDVSLDMNLPVCDGVSGLDEWLGRQKCAGECPFHILA